MCYEIHILLIADYTESYLSKSFREYSFEQIEYEKTTCVKKMRGTKIMCNEHESNE